MCLFCDIRDKIIPAEFLVNDDELMVFRDIHPKAKIHLLVVPKRHIASLNDLQSTDIDLAGKIILRMKDLAINLGVSQSGYRLVCNCGKDGGQEIEHLHFHFLGGEPIKF